MVVLGFLIYASNTTCKSTDYNLSNALDDNAIADSKFLQPACEYKTTEVRKQSLWFCWFMTHVSRRLPSGGFLISCSIYLLGFFSVHYTL